MNNPDTLRSGDKVVVLGGVHKDETGEIKKLVADEWSGSVVYVVKVSGFDIQFARGELKKMA